MKLSFLLFFVPVLIYKAAMAWKYIRFADWRVWLAAAAMLIPMAAVARPADAAATVTCTYTVSNSWGTGFVANLAITNNGPAINGWTLRWTFPTPTADVSGWQAVITVQGGIKATATNMSWDGTIATGQTASFGWSAAAVSTGVPTDLTINGTPC
jgi:hypothetical protein